MRADISMVVEMATPILMNGRNGRGVCKCKSLLKYWQSP
jgi:hypothetical protein